MPTKSSPCSWSSFFVIVVLIVFFMIIYSVVKSETFGLSFGRFEKFQSPTTSSELAAKDKLVVYQGVSVPDEPPTAVTWDKDPSAPSVDGKSDSPSAMFMMAFNKCDPSCCPSTYSCGGGCVCMTKEQQDFVGSRGSNNKATKCGGLSEF
jgi:hypothetical protein